MFLFYLLPSHLWNVSREALFVIYCKKLFLKNANYMFINIILPYNIFFKFSSTVIFSFTPQTSGVFFADSFFYVAKIIFLKMIFIYLFIISYPKTFLQTLNFLPPPPTLTIFLQRLISNIFQKSYIFENANYIFISIVLSLKIFPNFS